MLIARLKISYDRGIESNRPKDVGLTVKPVETKDGGSVRGLGTHFVSKEAEVLCKEREKEEARVRKAFRQKFLVTLIDGVFLVPAPGQAKKFIEELDVREDVQVTVAEFNLTVEQMSAEVVTEWAGRVKRQLSSVSLGRKKEEVDEDGLKALLELSNCPVLTNETSEKIRTLVAAFEAQKLDKIELRRSIEVLEVGIDDQALSPRRSPTLVG